MSSFWRTRASIGIADGDDIGGIGVFADGELAGRDDTFGLVADVQEHFVALDFDNGSADEVALVEVGHRTVDESMHLFVGVLTLLDDRAVLIYIAHLWTPSHSRGPGHVFVAYSYVSLGYRTSRRR